MGLKQFILVCCYSVFSSLMLTEAAKFLIEPLHDKVFVPCAAPNDKFFTEYFDLSDMHFTVHNDDNFEIGGTAKFLWDLNPEGNIEVKVETFRKKGIQYQPTILNLSKKNGCKALFDPEEMWYDMFPAHIAEEDKLCPNHHPQVAWRIPTYNTSLIIDVQGIEEGEYKMILQIKPYEKNDIYTNERICIEMNALLHRL